MNPANGNDVRLRRQRAAMTLGAALCVLGLATSVGLHEALLAPGDDGITPLVATDVPLPAGDASPGTRFLHVPAASGPASSTHAHIATPPGAMDARPQR